MKHPTTLLPIVTILAPIASFITTAAAVTCGSGDDIACLNNGTCKDGDKLYNELGFPTFSFLEQSKRGMHCSCPNEPAFPGHKGITGVHCEISYEMCPESSISSIDTKICFNGGECVAEQFRSDEFHCMCPQDPRGTVWAGLNCSVEASDFCQEDTFYDITGGQWFCTQGGKCQNGEDNLAKKCICPEGTFGLHCEFSQYEECSLTCFNRGTCKIGLKDFTHMQDYGLDIAQYLGGQDEYGEHCVCPEGFSGATCEVEDVVICGQGFCFNGASCVQTVSLDGKEVYNEYCRCKNDDVGIQFAGKFCEHEATTKCRAPYGHNPDEYFCTNGGACADEPHLPCECVNGYSGPQCEVAPTADLKDDCDLECLSGGECFFGQSPVVDKELKNLHTIGLDFLLDNKHCRCPEGFIGLRCEMRFEECGEHEHYCLHGSGCISDEDQYTCDCRDASTLLDSYAGSYCEHAATEFCQGSGANSESFCTNHGTCLGAVGVGEDHVGCRCKNGWTGQYCEFEKMNSNVAIKAFLGFGTMIVVIVVLFGGILFVRSRNDRDIEYEAANVEAPTLNPYGEPDSDLSDSSEDEYEFTDIAII